MRVFISREVTPGETRVAATPETVKRLRKDGLEVSVETAAGLAASFADAAYEAAGATIVPNAATGWRDADIVFGVRPPSAATVRAHARSGQVVLAFLNPYRETDLLAALVEKGVTSLPLELVPRISRAQSMDALSSQASLAGYKAVLLAAWRMGKYVPMLMTAAGTIPPARVVIMGAGVAGLQAIATAKRLGALVEVSDIRAVVKEQVESLGGKFIPLPELGETGEGTGGYAKEVSPEFLRRQREIVAERLTQADIVITTALVPGRPAPKLVTADMVSKMKAGAVIVDMAIEQGGNCELSLADQERLEHGVLILAPSNLPATAAADASTLYARNLVNLLAEVVKKGVLEIDRNNDVVAGTLLTYQGAVVHPAFTKA
jgi:NAD(P) transhydrogenase subunit alpha